MNHRPLILVIAATIGLTVRAPYGRAREYQWEDKKGTIHFTDRIEDLPEPLRSKAMKEFLEQQERDKANKSRSQPGPDDMPSAPAPKTISIEKPENGSSSSSSGPSSSGPSSSPSVSPSETQAPQRAYWKERANSATARVNSLETQCQKLREAGPAPVLERAMYGRVSQAGTQRDEELKQCEADLAAEKKFLEEDLPQEAKRAGVPAAWIR